MDDILRDLRIGACFLTRLPVPWPQAAPADGLARAMRLFPVVGAGIGLGAGLVWALALWCGAPPLVAALLALAGQMVLTGALHEDGLADVADGFGAGRDRERTLEIMRDSRIGSYGTLALVLSAGLRAAALAALAGPGGSWSGAAAMVAAGAVSRAACPALLAWLPPARPDGLGAGAGALPREALITALGLALCFALLLLKPWPALAALGLGLLATVALAMLARRRIGGQTGDVLGAGQQLVEIAVLCTAAAAA